MRVKNVFSVVGSVLLMLSPAAMAEEDAIVVAEEAAVPSPPAAAQAENAETAQTETAQAASPNSTKWVQQMAPIKPCNSGFKFSGYLNAGGLFNDHGAALNENSVNSDNQIGFDGAYASIVKQARTGYGVADWGWGLDAMFGRDARFLSSYTGFDSRMETGHRADGTESYGFAFPQVYGEMAVNNLAVKMGHFYTPFGYESARADQRFFYSFGRHFETTPITHTGALATYKGIAGMEISAGWVMGENNLFERDYGESLVLGSIKLLDGNRTSLKYDILKGTGAMFDQSGDLFRNDVVFTTKLDPLWETALLVNYGKFTPDGGDAFKYTTLGGYLFYDLCPGWKLGGRAEWQRQWGGSDSQEFIDLGFGINWALGGDNLLLRPEIRYDRAVEPIFGDGTEDSQLCLGFDVLYKI
ncbi:MAG: outer membrane beta-barrel protein [Thermoguttaceae bacterium]|nr:outer membrane beta-barrel protein [Thermoguttaceae bacterium]